MQAVILAGGLGTRLKPITEKIPKCMVPVCGKPFLFFLLRMLRMRGFQDVVLCIGYLGGQVEAYFGRGEKLGMKLRYSQEREMLLGTGGALKQAEKFLDASFFVINGDTYLDIDYNRVADLFLKCGKKSLVVASLSKNSSRSDMEIDDRLMVTRYDKEAREHLGYVNAGVLALTRDVVSEIDLGRVVSLEKEIFPLLIGQHEMVAYITDQKFYDIGTSASLQTYANYLMENEQ